MIFTYFQFMDQLIDGYSDSVHFKDLTEFNVTDIYVGY